METYQKDVREEKVKYVKERKQIFLSGNNHAKKQRQAHKIHVKGEHLLEEQAVLFFFLTHPEDR